MDLFNMSEQVPLQFQISEAVFDWICLCVSSGVVGVLTVLCSPAVDSSCVGRAAV